jgi:hypothetical protein
MKNYEVTSFSFLLAVLVTLPSLVAADTILSKADSLYTRGGIDNIKASLPFYQQVMESQPQNYEAAWKCARAHRDYGDLIKKRGDKGWKDVCAEYGKKAMGYAEKAATLEPDRPEGHFYYAVSVGTYSDGVSILTALREGLKNKTQHSLERACQADLTYQDGGPPLALGRFWAVVPWPFKDREKALQYYRQYQQVTKYVVSKHERMLYIAELLIELGDKHLPEARAILKEPLGSKSRFIKEWAERLQGEID